MTLRVTILESQSGRCRIHINSGGPKPWCSFDYVLQPDAALVGSTVEIGQSPDEETQRLFPFVAQGIELGLNQLRQHYGRELVGLRVVISKVYSHPIDTTPEGCKYYGARFIEGLGRGKTVHALLD